MSIKEHNTRSLIIVIVNYFTAQDCISLIEDILGESIPELQKIICVDNSCNEAELLLLKSINHEKLTLKVNNKNLGFGAAINKAVKGETFDSLLFINPDVKLAEHAIQHVLNAQNQKGMDGIWGGLTVDESGAPDFFHAWRFPSLLREFAWLTGLASIAKFPLLVNHYAFEEISSNYPVDIVSGCFFLISGDAWRELGGFDERFFLYSEEVDLCLRAKQNNIRSEVVVNAKLIHARGVSSNNESARLKWTFSSKLVFWKKHGGELKAKCMRVLYCLGSFTRSVAYQLLPNKKHLAKPWLELTCFLLKGSANKSEVKR